MIDTIIALIGLSSILGFIICLLMLIISALRKNGKVKSWAIRFGICFAIFFICIAMNLKTTNNSTSSSSNLNTQNEKAKQAEQIKLLQEKYKPLLESGKSYENMTDEEGKTAEDLILNWDKLEEEFKTSYQTQKDSISKSIDDYNAKKKAAEEAKKAEEAKQAAAAAAQKAAEEKQADIAKRKNEGVRIGMTKDEVLMSNWGKPDKINKTTNAYGVHEQWVYRSRGSGYLYFDDGILTSIQN
jgi:hypothetical protein